MNILGFTAVEKTLSFFMMMTTTHRNIHLLRIAALACIAAAFLVSSAFIARALLLTGAVTFVVLLQRKAVDELRQKSLLANAGGFLALLLIACALFYLLEKVK